MHWLIDESKLFIHQVTPPMKWKIAVVGGAILPYAGRKKWFQKHKWIGKASDYTDEAQVCNFLDDFIACKISGSLVVGEIGHVSVHDAEKFRQDWLSPHYAFADSEPQLRGNDLRRHLDNLQGNGQHKLSLQDFFKLLAILEVISSFIKIFTQDLHTTRTIDIRKLKLIIDDQAKASLMSLKEFVHYFLYCRSQEGLYASPPGTMHLINRYIRKEGNNTFLNTNILLNDILVDENANQDDRYCELKIVDLISNFSQRALHGEFSPKVAQRLQKILKVIVPISFDPCSDIKVTVPTKSQYAVNLLLGRGQ